MTKTYISSLRLRNFKSFGKPTTLDFSPGLNCIIGANGSGKSNTLDALCFVLGRLSTKSIRAENYGDLIHRSKVIQNATEGEVAIRFNNQARIFPVDYDILSLNRQIRKTGQTQYRVNAKRATRNQVLEILGANKITPEGHNIILQGDVERFVGMSPVDKRKLIEEVAGIWVYEHKKESALKELAKVSEKLREVEIVMSEKRAYMQSLESEKKIAEKFRSYQNELEQARVSELRIKLKQLNERKATVGKKLEVIDKKNKQIENKSKALQSNIDILDKKLETVEKEIEKRGGEAQLELQKTIDNLKREIDNGKSIIKSSENEIKRIDVRKQQLQNNLEDLNKKVKVKTEEISALKKKRASYESKKSQIEKVVGISESDLKNIDTVLETKEKEIESLKSDLEATKERIQGHLSELKILEFKLSQSDEKLSEIAAKERQLKALKHDKDRYKKLVIDINKLRSEDSKLSSDIQDLRSDLHAQEDASARLRSSINAAQDLIMRDRAVSKILSSKGKVKGVIGTVAELGRIDSNLKTAIGVAAGNRMKNIVVDNESTAVKCLELLRESKAGVATFLPLNKISAKGPSSYAKMAQNKKGVIGLASELVSCDPKYKSVFQHIFRDTLIIENTQTARALGIGKFNMITLKGDLFGSSGAITGGFRRSSGMSFMEKDAGAKLDVILSEIDSITKEIKSREKKRRKFEEQLYKLQTEKAELEGLIGALDESEINPGEVKQQKSSLLASKTDLEKGLKALHKKEKDVTEEINKKTVERNSIKSKAKELQFGKKKQEISDLENKISEYDGKISVAESLLENSLQLEKKNIAKVLLGLAKEREEFLSQISNEKKGILRSRKTLTEKEKEEKQFFGELKKLFSEKSLVSEKIKGLEKEYRENRELLLGEDEEKNALTISVAKIDAELSVVKEEYDPLKETKPLAHLKTQQDAKKLQSELKRKIENMGNVNMRALEIFEEVRSEFEKLTWRVNKLRTESDSITDVINRIETKKKDTFLTTFNKINEHFTKTLLKVTDTMTGRLILENEKSPFEGGVKVEIKGANKARKSLFALSGGEKTLTALSFIFAIQSVDPAPFYLLDEIDAALDKVNSEKVALLLKEHSKNAQVIIISHNDAIIHAADNIYGVWKTKDGTSQLNSLRV